jgi:hypothetical protein
MTILVIVAAGLLRLVHAFDTRDARQTDPGSRVSWGTACLLGLLGWALGYWMGQRDGYRSAAEKHEQERVRAGQSQLDPSRRDLP